VKTIYGNFFLPALFAFAQRCFISRAIRLRAAGLMVPRLRRGLVSVGAGVVACRLLRNLAMASVISALRSS